MEAPDFVSVGPIYGHPLKQLENSASNFWQLFLWCELDQRQWSQSFVSMK